MQGRFAKEISKLKGFIETHKREPDEIPFLCQLESRLQCFHLSNKLNSILNSASGSENDFIRLCESFLKERWNLIASTQSVYFRTQYSVINRACILLAKLLSGMTGKPAYEYLMPTVNSKHYDIMKVDKRIKLEDMVLGDNNEIIFVQKCLQNFEKNRQLQHTYISNGPVLSVNEKFRVMHHSRESKEYYDAFRLGDDSKVESKKNALFDLILTKKPKLKYDSRGYQDEKLVEFILSQLTSVFDLARYMQTNINRNDYSDFLLKFFSKEHCADFASFQGGTYVQFRKILDKQLVNIEDELLTGVVGQQKKEELFLALSMVILYCCRQIRKEGAEFNYPGSSVLNSLSSYYSGSYSKQQKIDAMKALIDYFSSTDAKMIALPTFLNQSSTIKPHIAALKSGQLEWFVNTIEGFSSHFLDDSLRQGYQRGY